jgi:D-alanine-D-alanine ligase
VTYPILSIAAADKRRLKIMFLAKHAFSDGSLDPADGSHAVYHHELRSTLEAIGMKIVPASSYEALLERPDVDFVFTLLNRGGFVNSEMLGPLLSRRIDLPFLGASPILRGLSDDKHLMKTVAAYRGVPVTPWITIRQGQGGMPSLPEEWDQIVIKPNASSASWGVLISNDRAALWAKGEEILASGHDVIIEPYAPLIDVAVPVVGGDGEWILPPFGYVPESKIGMARSYEEKRNLVPSALEEDPLEPVTDMQLATLLVGYTKALLPELWPFDYGRFEYRYDPKTGDVRFMEVNLSCNLWSKKTISRSARSLGFSHAELVENILAHSLERQGLIEAVRRRKLTQYVAGVRG